MDQTWEGAFWFFHQPYLEKRRWNMGWGGKCGPGQSRKHMLHEQLPSNALSPSIIQVKNFPIIESWYFQHKQSRQIAFQQHFKCYFSECWQSNDRHLLMNWSDRSAGQRKMLKFSRMFKNSAVFSLKYYSKKLWCLINWGTHQVWMSSSAGSWLIISNVAMWVRYF